MTLLTDLRSQDLEQTWPHTKYEDVVWLNKPPEKEKECAEMAILNVLEDLGAEEESLFGKGERLEIWESHLVILVEISKASERELPEIGAKTW